VRLDAIIGLMIDRPHVDHIFEVGEGAFDLISESLERHSRITSNARLILETDEAASPGRRSGF
jgi:hypothetical protein